MFDKDHGSLETSDKGDQENLPRKELERMKGIYVHDHSRVDFEVPLERCLEISVKKHVKGRGGTIKRDP